MTTLRAISPAKVTLYLHVGPPLSDGRHPLDSLVVFADENAADLMTFTPAESSSLTVTAADGTNIDEIGPSDDNLVVRAARRLTEALGRPLTGAFTLEKHLPIAAGLGGGSANAATALHLLNQAFKLELSNDDLAEISIPLGGDVPACVIGSATLMRQDGREVEPLKTKLPSLPALLINPGVSCPTGPVFKEFDRHPPAITFIERDAPTGETTTDMIAALQAFRNDLEPAAVNLVPEIGVALSQLRGLPSVRLARLAGSGASCFALFDDLESCRHAEQLLNQQKPHWWTTVTALG